MCSWKIVLVQLLSGCGDRHIDTYFSLASLTGKVHGGRWLDYFLLMKFNNYVVTPSIVCKKYVV